MPVLLLLSLAAQQPASPPPPPPPPAAKRTVEFTGTILMNSFYNSARTNNSDVPTFADSDTVGVTGASATVRQSRLGLFVNDPEVLGGTFSGELDVDFYGGQLTAPGNRTFPVLRVRRAIGTMEWTNLQVMVGQEAPLISDRNPLSLASIGVPGFTAAGNLWLWIPQLRVTTEFGYTLRLALQAALLAPIAGGVQGPVNTQPDSGERTNRPYIQGRVRLGWGPTDDPSEVAIGGHIGWLRGLDSTTGDTLIQSNAISLDARLRFGAFEFLGEAFTGQAVAGLGGGGIGQNFGVSGMPVNSDGAWGQLNVRPRAGWMFGGGCGVDDPDDIAVPATGRFRNFVCEGHVEWRPPGPLVIGFEFRRLKTTHQAGDFVVNHLNLATGFRF